MKMMYIPPSFNVNDKEIIFDFIQQNSFAILFSQKDNYPVATHLPLILGKDSGENGCLYGHMARANPHWKEIENEVLVVFSGPHTYISPSWYETDLAVPTWNYAAVHVYGTFHLIEDNRELIKILNDSVDYYESSFPNPWHLGNIDSNYIENLSKGIVGFKIEITRIEGKWKLSQNHPEERQKKVIKALETYENENSKKIAELMKTNLDK
jgi:transcriptional regulator